MSEPGMHGMDGHPIDLGKCQCCNDEPAVGVASLPGIAMSIAWGEKCLKADIIPYWAAVANTACCDGLENTNPEWQDLVKATLDYFGKSMTEFTADVDKSLEEERAYFEREQAGESG